MQEATRGGRCPLLFAWLMRWCPKPDLSKWSANNEYTVSAGGLVRVCVHLSASSDAGKWVWCSMRAMYVSSMRAMYVSSMRPIYVSSMRAMYTYLLCVRHTSQIRATDICDASLCPAVTSPQYLWHWYLCMMAAHTIRTMRSVVNYLRQSPKARIALQMDERNELVQRVVGNFTSWP